jgi:hypothetical protein
MSPSLELLYARRIFAIKNNSIDTPAISEIPIADTRFEKKGGMTR